MLRCLYSSQDWIADKSVRLVDEITNGNFVYYESLRRPMLLLFLDKKANNRDVLRSMKAVAKRYKGSISCGWLDGKMYAGAPLAHCGTLIAVGKIGSLLVKPPRRENGCAGAYVRGAPCHRN